MTTKLEQAIKDGLNSGLADISTRRDSAGIEDELNLTDREQEHILAELLYYVQEYVKNKEGEDSRKLTLLIANMADGFAGDPADFGGMLKNKLEGK